MLLKVVAPGKLSEKKKYYFGFDYKAVTKTCLRNNVHINKPLVVLYLWSVKLEA